MICCRETNVRTTRFIFQMTVQPEMGSERNDGNDGQRWGNGNELPILNHFTKSLIPKRLHQCPTFKKGMKRQTMKIQQRRVLLEWEALDTRAPHRGRSCFQISSFNGSAVPTDPPKCIFPRFKISSE